MSQSWTSAGHKITTTFSGNATQRSYAIWSYRTGEGISSSSGRLWDRGNSFQDLFFNSNATQYQWLRAWSGGVARWLVTKPAANEWHHVVLTYDGSSTSNSPIIYIDGISVAVTRNAAPIGTLSNGSGNYTVGNSPFNDRTWSGYHAEFAIWDRVLTADEAAALGNGYAPSNFRQSLVTYVPMVREVIDFMRSKPTVSGTTVVEHPRIIYPY